MRVHGSPDASTVPGAEGDTCSDGGDCAAPLECRQGHCLESGKTYAKCVNHCGEMSTAVEWCMCFPDSNPFQFGETIESYASPCKAPEGLAPNQFSVCCEGAESCSCTFSRWRCGEIVTADAVGSCLCGWDRTESPGFVENVGVFSCDPRDALTCCARENATLFTTDACRCAERPCSAGERQVATCADPPEPPACSPGTTATVRCAEGAEPQETECPEAPPPGSAGSSGGGCRSRGDSCTGDDECCGGFCCGDLMGCC